MSLALRSARAKTPLVLSGTSPDRFFGYVSEIEEHALRSAHIKPVQDIELPAPEGIKTLNAPNISLPSRRRLPLMIAIAGRAAAEKAVSYRDFYVGACGYFTDGERIGYFYGANYKPEEDAPKWCAEMSLMKKAQDAGFTHLGALAVFGPSDFSSVYETDTKTLHPCEPCLNMLAESPLVDDTTRIATTNATKTIDLLSLNHLLAIHTGSTEPV